jgi:MFS family permease
MQNVPNQELPASHKYKILTLTSLGHIMELYDFILYGVMLSFLAKAFLPDHDPNFSMFLASLSFAITFLITPIGSIFWGWYGDKFGRISMLNISMILMAIPSISIALLPTYKTIGILAPIILIFLRIMQGISASGEIIGAKIFAMEAIGDASHGLSSGIITAAGAIGILLAMYMGYLTSTSSLEYFWRIPFILGSVLFIFATMIRKNLSAQMKIHHDKLPNKEENQSISAIIDITKNNPHASLIVFVLGAMLGILSYTLHVFINPFLIKLGFDAAVVFKHSLIGYSATIVGAILAGIYVDKYCNINELFLRSLKGIVLAVTLLFLPLFLLILLGSYCSIIGFFVLDFLLGSYATISAIMMYKAFPKDVRCRGVLMNYAFGCGVFGGITPLILGILGDINIYLPAFAVTICFFVIYFVLKWSLRKC